MDTKAIGNIGEAKALCKFVELGVPVYISFGDNERADLIADFNGKLNRIQVKTSVKAENGKMIFDLTSSTVHRKNGVKHKYSLAEIDYFVCYNIARDALFLVPNKEEGMSAITIRYMPPLNGMTKGIHYAEDFSFERILCVETLHEVSNSEKK